MKKEKLKSIEEGVIRGISFDSPQKGDNQNLLFENKIKSKWLTVKEASSYLRVSEGQLRNMVYRGQVKSYHLLNRLRFLRSDLDELIKISI